jgi:hypothetical protein
VDWIEWFGVGVGGWLVLSVLLALAFGRMLGRTAHARY